MSMSIVFSELSLDYGSALGQPNQISLFRFRTNPDNTGQTGGLVLNPLDAVPLAQRDLFEIQVVLSGDVGRVIRNDFGSGFTNMQSAKRLTHRVERSANDPEGTTSGSLICTVNVRRIAHHPDGYSRQMILNHSITTQGSGGGSTWDGALPLGNQYNDIGFYDGRPALVELLFRANGTIALRKNYPTATETILGNWSGVVANSTNTQIQVTTLSGQPPSNNPLVNWTTINQDRVFSYSTQDGSSDSSRGGIVRILLRDSNNTNTIVTRDVTLYVEVFSDGSGGGGGGDGPSGWIF